VSHGSIAGEKPMKIALVAYALNVGGMESFLFGLARSLRNTGLEPAFVVTEATGDWHANPLAEGFSVTSVLPRKWQSSRCHARRVAAALGDFDAVILNHSSAAQSAAGLLPESAAVISVLHNDMEDMYRVGLANRANVDWFVAVGEQVLKEAIKRGAPPERVSCIRNGVEVFHGYPKRDGFPGSHAPLRVIYVGRIEHEQKGVFYLPGIAAAMRDRGANATFDVVGDGNDSRALRARIEKLGLAALVTFHGALPHAETMRMVSSADVLVMPSHYEGQPITLFEAMARGVVPLASRLPGITDSVITEGRDGFLAQVGDEAAFAEKLALLAADRELLGRLSRAAWRSALERFGIDAMASRYVALIEKCSKLRRDGAAGRRTGRLYLPLLGKRSQFPLFLHEALRDLKRRACCGRSGREGAGRGN